MLNGEEQDRLREMEDWIIKNEGTWVLAEGFNTFLGKYPGKKELINSGIKKDTRYELIVVQTGLIF